MYISGQVGCGAELDSSGNRVFSSDIQVQARQCLENVGCVLKEAGMTFDNVVKMSIYLDDMRGGDAHNK